MNRTTPKEHNYCHDLEKGVFHSTENYGLNFLKFPVENGISFSGISGKEDNLAMYIQSFGNFLLGISVPFDFPPGISGIFVWMVRISEIQQFLIFRNLPRKFPYHLPPFRNFWNFWFNGKSVHAPHHWSTGRLPFTRSGKALGQRFPRLVSKHPERKFCARFSVYLFPKVTRWTWNWAE